MSEYNRDPRARIFGAFAATAVVGGLLAAGMALPAAGAASALANAAVESFEAMPDDLETPQVKQRTILLDADGNVIANYWGDNGNRIAVPLAEISPLIQKAIVAVEDARFYEHNGVDLRGTARALATNSGAGEIQQGGSTITQQYVKQVLLNSATTDEERRAAIERTPQRKLREASYAIALEKKWTKEQILEAYLNIAYFGAGADGIEVAAERYFGIRSKDVNLPQAALLAGLVQQPGAYDPLEHPEAAEGRRNVVLQRMLQQGMITQAEYDSAVATPVTATLNPVEVPNGCPRTAAPFFCDFVLKSFLADPRFGASREERQAKLNLGGMFIRTTLNSRVQAEARAATFDAIPPADPSGKAVAITMVEPKTGRVLAMAQNRDWGIEGAGVTTYNYNVDIARGGTQGMQAGSTMKMFTMLAALEKGISPYETIASPPERTFYNFRSCDGRRFPPYTVKNSTKSGTFDMYSGAAWSVNTYFVALAERTPLCRQAEIAESMGVLRGTGEKLDQYPSFPLGSIEVTPLGMAGAYAAVANGGVYCTTHAIDAIDAYTGRNPSARLYTAQPECNRVVSESVAQTVARILVGVVQNGTGRTVAFGRPVAGKTGTTDSNAAVWFDGFTPQVAAAVWVGDPRGGYKYPLRNLVINGKYVQAGFGSTLAGPVFKRAMIAAHEGLPVEYFNFSKAIKTPPPKPKPKPTESKPSKPSQEPAKPTPAPPKPDDD